jgi:hypothetical protein
VTSSQFWNLVSKDPDGFDLTEWQVRKNGGLGNLRKLAYGEAPKTESIPTKVTFRPQIPKLQNFKTHHSNIGSLFKKAGLKKNDVFRVVVQPDTHTPDHDPDAVNCFMDFLSDYKPHGLINLGDFLEMESVSHFKPKDPRPKRLVPEMKKARHLLHQITDAAGPQCRYKAFLEGNHEFWLQGYLNERIPEVLDGLEELGISLELKELLSLEDLGYYFVPINEILGLGDANFIHGYYTSKHHASKHLSVFKANVYYGHLHDTQGTTEISVRGLYESMSLGCLRSLNASFLNGKPNNWCHSFGIFEFRYDGSYTRYVPIIIDGKFSFNGKVYGP